MTKFECENKDELKAQCNHYKSIFSTKSFSETSHLRRHLNSCLKIFNKDITQYTIATKPSLEGGSSIKTYKFDADECRRAVSTFLVCDKHAFRTVEEPGFRYMISIFSLNFKNKSRQTTIRDVLMYYAKERDHVKEELAKTHGLICPTSNNWNSEHNNDEYICITAHWVDKDWKLQKRIIRFRGLSPPYDVKAGLELVADVVSKIQNKIKYIKKLGICRKIFYDMTDKSFHLNVTKKLRRDVNVRWNSTYLMFESTLYYKYVLDYWGQWDKDYQILALFDEEWRNVAILCKLLNFL
ncbi:hypothetical protein Gohar_006740 [Gossypium harknessii]|uniref:hAT-like transposase RNase-H fold domain-containing protein n=1 Tax=Gossypium harknessii TaxID=34285 RepID=A0A7J9GGH1_9ROSI|nr:hypothetical protein [Gossypium harknessii]